MADNKSKAKEKKTSFWQGVKQEWRKIIWVPKNKLAKQSGLVVVISLLLGIIISVIDQGAIYLINWLLSL